MSPTLGDFILDTIRKGTYSDIIYALLAEKVLAEQEEPQRNIYNQMIPITQMTVRMFMRGQRNMWVMGSGLYKRFTVFCPNQGMKFSVEEASVYDADLNSQGTYGEVILRCEGVQVTPYDDAQAMIDEYIGLYPMEHEGVD